ncbi:T-cell surface glycoprotein CD1a-like [Lithobates pipiens]
MKVLIPCFILSLLVPLSITAAGSVTMTCMQNVYLSNGEIQTVWGSLEMEDIEIGAFHNDTRTIEFKQSWSKANFSLFDWKFIDIFLRRYIDNTQKLLRKINEELGIEDSYLIQAQAGCSSSLGDYEGLTYRVAKDGEDLMYLNVTEGVWVAGIASHSQDFQRIMKKEKTVTESIINILRNYCPSLAAIYSSVGRETFARKIQPQVYITKTPFKSDIEVICIVTGFYPKPINVSLWRENNMEDAISNMILPNGDGTYQITVLITVNFLEQKSVYCRVEHSSLKEPLIVHLNEEHHNLIGLVVGTTVAVVVCVFGLACFVHRLYKKHK